MHLTGETVHRSSKPDLQGMRASFFSNNNTSTTTTNSLSSRLVKPSSFTNSEADANKGIETILDFINKY